MINNKEPKPVYVKDNNNVSGRLGSILPAPNNNPNAGLLQLLNTQGVPEEAVSLCRIASIIHIMIA